MFGAQAVTSEGFASWKVTQQVHFEKPPLAFQLAAASPGPTGKHPDHVAALPGQVGDPADQ